MDITLVGISHKTAPVAVRERFAFEPDELPAALSRFGGAAVLLSTCNRTEVYLAAHHPITERSVIALLCEIKGCADTPLDGFFHLTGTDAARHLFRVAAGIESMVLGEFEVLGHVSSTAVALARRTVGDLTRRTVLVVSAGEAGKLAARSLAEQGVSRLLVTNRTAASAREVAADLGGEPFPLQQLGAAMAQADIVISSSWAPIS